MNSHLDPDNPFDLDEDDDFAPHAGDVAADDEDFPPGDADDPGQLDCEQ